ncbi:cysteine desulfurase NifS [Desulfobacterales bacterium HSG17]|nr:cysteine desulfurase NifS [Desulfobacterales bacterium HSG17]
MKAIYLDNNATTRVAPEVTDAMLPFFSEYYGNPSSMHRFGGQVGEKIALARAQVADLIGADPREIIFTSCGTESDSTAIRAALAVTPDKKHIITTKVEHPAIKNLGEFFSKNGYRVTFVPVDKHGALDLDFLYDRLDENVALVSVMWANNETGVIFPVEEISRKVADQGILFHTDAVQAVGKIPIDVTRTGIHMLSLSGHKIHAPKGIGALYVKKGTRFAPFMIGGHQEGGRRGGTENVASIIGLGAACRLAHDSLEDINTRIRTYRDKLESKLTDAIPKVIINGGKSERLPNTTNISFEYIEGEAILLLMDEFNICASSGSACTSGSLEPSHVLRAMGVPFTAAHGSIRFSLSHYTTESEIDFVIEKMPPIIERLRSLSPFWQEAKNSA